MTGGGGKKDPPDDRTFAEMFEEFDGVVRSPSDPAAPRPAARAASARKQEPAPRRSPMQHPDADEPLVAHRSFVRRKQLRELRAGAIRPDRDLDLHGHDRRRAEKLVQQTLREARRAGERCVLIVVGRGRHSAGGVAVLRDELPRWLSDPALEQTVAAFAPAIQSDGGRGALYVLLA